MLEILYLLFIYPIEFLMSFLLENFYELVGSYGIAIILMSLVVNIFILPLYYLAENYKNQDQKIRAKMSAKIAYFKKYFQGREQHFYLQTLYKQHHYSQLSSVKASMGLLLQIPFFFAAFHLLGNYPAFNNISFWVISDLNQPDGLLFGLNLLPVLMTLINLFSAYFYVKNMQKSDIYQLWVMAGIFLVLLYFEPAALLIYWTFNNLFSLFKNIWHSKFNTGKYKLSTSFRLKNHRLNNFSQKIYQKIKLSKVKFSLIFITAIVLSKIAIDYENTVIGNICFVLAALIFFILVMVLLLDYIVVAKYKNTLYTSFIILVIGTTITLAVFISFEGFNYYGRGFLNLILFLFLVLSFNKILSKLSFLTIPTPSFKLFIKTFSVLSLLILIINPIILYNSTNDFIISSQFLLKNLLLFFSLSVIGLGVFYKLSNKSIQNILMFSAVFLLFISIIYSFVIVKNYGLMDHFTFHAPELLNPSTLITIIELLFLGFLLFATIYIVQNHRSSLNKIISGFGIFLLVFFGFNIPNANQKTSATKAEKPHQNFDLEYEKSHTMAMSKEKNILVFFLDGFAGDVINQILKKNPEILKQYQGFVWYKNTLSNTSHTWGSIAAMFGGKDYTVTAINQKQTLSLQQEINHAYNVFPKYFTPQSWDISYYNPQYATKINENVHKIDENHYKNYLFDKNNQPTINNLKKDLEINLLQIISLFKAAPLSMKTAIYSNGSWSQIFDSVKQSQNTALKTAAVWGFFNAFNDLLNTKSPNKTLKYFQLSTPHYPYGITMAGTINPAKSSYFIESYQAIEKIGQIIQKLKDNKIYDKTKIIITSDHGWRQGTKSDDFDSFFASKILLSTGKVVNRGSIQALLMVKDFNANDDFRISNRFMSNQDVPIIICSVLKNNCNLADKNPIKNNLNRNISTFEVGIPNFKKDKKFKIEYHYQVKDNIFDYNNWQLIE